MLLARLGALAIGVLAFAATGRLIAASEFGHFAFALAAWQALLSLSEFGLRNYIIREKEIGTGCIGSAMGLSLTLSAACAAALALAALAAREAGLADPAAAAAALILAPALVPAAMGTVAEGVLQRDLDFRLIWRITVARAAVDAAMAVGLALMGFGAAALAWGVLASHLLATGILVAGSGHAAELRPRRAGWRRFVPFGLRSSGTSALPSAAGFLLVAVLSALQGAAAVGLYNRALTIHQIFSRTFVEGLRPVVLPAITHGLAAGMTPAEVHGRKMDYLAAVSWPVFALIALLADEIVRVLLGPGWEGAVPVVRILALMGLTLPVNVMSFKTFVATGQEAAYLRITAWQMLTALALGLAGASVSLEAFCAASVAASWVKAANILHASHRLFGPARPALAAIALRGAMAAGAALAGPALLLYARQEQIGPALSGLGLLVPCAGLALAGWLAALVAMRHGVVREMRIAAGLAGPD